MEIQIRNVKYHRAKDESIPITEPQATLLIADIVQNALASGGFVADVEIKHT